MPYNNDYVLLTAARNEENHIERTIKSVISQSQLPLKWIIVSNNTTDSTESIVRSYEKKHGFMKLISSRSGSKRNFSEKINAINTGIESLSSEVFNYIGILDADIELPPEYYQLLINKCSADPEIGIAGGDVYDVFGHKLHRMPKSPNSVRGAVQLFSWQCFESIGGIKSFEYGGEDTVAEIKARMKGFKVCTFYDLIAFHHRRTGTGATSILRSYFRIGLVEHSLGYHPVFQMVKCIRRTFYPPYITGSLMRFCGYWWAKIIQRRRILQQEEIIYLRNEQLERLKSILVKRKSQSRSYTKEKIT